MKLKTKVGQILLTHPKDENYTSLYEETLRKQGKTVELFAVIELTAEDNEITAEKKRGYRKLEQTIVSALKKAYVATEVINEAAFEKALATVNAALSRFASHNKVKWLGHLNVVLAAFYQNKLSLATTGNGQTYLVRENETSQISEEQDHDEVKPVKVFSTFTTGKLKANDRVILSSNQIFNFLSLQRIKDFVRQERLSDVCEDIIESLQDVKNVGFATFVFEITQEGTIAAQTEEEDLPVIDSKPQPIALEKIKAQKTLYFILVTIWTALKQLGLIIWKLLTLILRFFRRGSRNISLSSKLQKPRTERRKLIRIAIGLAVVILVISVSVAAWNRSTSNRQAAIENKITEAEKQLNDAEARLIFEDGDRAVELVAGAETLIKELEGQASDERYQELADRLREIKQKVEKKVVIENPTILTEFPNIPTELLRSPNGMLGYNKNSGSVSFYDFRTGQTSQLLSSENTSSLLLGDYVGGAHSYLFLDRDGNFKTLSPSQNSLSSYEVGPSVADLTDRKIQSLTVFGTGNSARVYLLDSLTSEILRASVTEEGVGTAANWLSGSADLSDSLDLAVDGNIYVLFSDQLNQYFRGQKTSFSLSSVLPQLRNATKIYATAELQFIYVLDPDNHRILVFDKDGQLANQIISDKFREITDLYPDEQTDIIYALTGSELLQINLE